MKNSSLAGLDRLDCRITSVRPRLVLGFYIREIGGGEPTVFRSRLRAQSITVPKSLRVLPRRRELNEIVTRVVTGSVWRGWDRVLTCDAGKYSP